MPLPAVRLAADQPSGLQLPQVASGGRPGMGKSPGQLTRGHRATPGVKHLQDVSAGWVGKSVKDLLDLVELPLAPAGSRAQ
jgi:hypothetical protein